MGINYPKWGRYCYHYYNYDGDDNDGASCKVDQSTDKDNKAEISKKAKTINKDILRLGSSKTKKWNNYDLLLAFNK